MTAASRTVYTPLDCCCQNCTTCLSISSSSSTTTPNKQCEGECRSIFAKYWSIFVNMSAEQELCTVSSRRRSRPAGNPLSLGHCSQINDLAPLLPAKYSWNILSEVCTLTDTKTNIGYSRKTACCLFHLISSDRSSLLMMS